MNEPNEVNELYALILFIVYVLSLIHICWESVRLKDYPVRNTLMVAICFWPLGYLFWIVYWPGSVRRFLSGKAKLESSIREGIEQGEREG